MPIVQRRLDLWLAYSSLQEDVDYTAIIPSIKPDHSAITLAIKSVESQTHGPSFWNFNTSLLNDCDYVALINNNYLVWQDKFKDITDPRLLWDPFKYKIRQDAISYSKEKAKKGDRNCQS